MDQAEGLDVSTAAKVTTSEEGTERKDQEAKIAKAIRFWNHPSLRDIPVEQKRIYLHEKGVTEEQIHRAWDRIVEDDSLDLRNDTVPVSSHASGSSHPLQQVPSSYHGATQPPPPSPAAMASPYTSNPYMASTPYPTQPSPAASYDPYRTNYNPQAYYEEEEGVGPIIQGVSLVGLGGALGLTAAAAVRWLNGGDFHLLPPPTTEGTSTGEGPVESSAERTEVAPPITGEEESDEEVVYVDEVDQDGQGIYMEEEEKSLDLQEQLLQQMASISQSMKAQTVAQEKLLERFPKPGSKITDQSMNLLRPSSQTENKAESSSVPGSMHLWTQLVEIKAELRSLQLQNGSATNGDKLEVEGSITSLLGRLDKCLSKLESSQVPSVESTQVATETTEESPANKTSHGSDAKVKDDTKDKLDPEKQSTEDVSKNENLTLRQAIQKLAENNEEETLRGSAQLLYLYIINLSGNPKNPRYRKIFTTNGSFQKVEAAAGGTDVLLAIGFEQVQSGCFEWLPNVSPVPEDALARLRDALAALQVLKSGAPTSDLIKEALATLSSDADTPISIASPDNGDTQSSESS